MKRILVGSVFVLALVGAGCDDHDDDDYSYQTENCTSVDNGGGERYELCCRLTCYGDYDYDDYYERCDEDYSCIAFAGGNCSPDVVDEFGYPRCIY